MHRLARVSKISKVVLSVPFYSLSPNKAKYAMRLRKEIEDTGCLAVKIGQWISSRTDVFPAELTKEFSKLRSDVAPMPPQKVMSILQTEVGPDYFEWFDETPLSTGSIAQVHRAVLNSQEVAVKIQRPGLAEELADDIAFIQSILIPYQWINPKMHDDLVLSLKDLVATIQGELDFEVEAEHMKRFGVYFIDNPKFRIPEVYGVTSKTLIMEYVPSTPLGSPDISNRLMELFFLQFFELGYVHTDLHGGNLGLDMTSDAIVVYDFGSVMECPQNVRMCVKHLMVAYLNRNPQMMLDYLLEYGVLRPSTISDEERKMLENFVDNVVTYAEASDIQEFTGNMKRIALPESPSNIHFQPELFMMLRSFTLLEGLCKDLDKDFVILRAVTPLISYFATDPMVYRLKIEDDLRTMLNFFTSEL